jgi:hypothetical protein
MRLPQVERKQEQKQWQLIPTGKGLIQKSWKLIEPKSGEPEIQLLGTLSQSFIHIASIGERSYTSLRRLVLRFWPSKEISVEVLHIDIFAHPQNDGRRFLRASEAQPQLFIHIAPIGERSYTGLRRLGLRFCILTFLWTPRMTGIVPYKYGTSLNTFERDPGTFHKKLGIWHFRKTF